MNKKVLLFDMNNLAMRTVHITDVKHVDKDTKKVISIDWEYWKLLMFSNIYSSLYKVPVKEMVLAIDSKDSWRYSVWPRYKEDRKAKNKDNTDDFPWDEYYEQYQSFLDDIKNHFPIKVIKIDEAEADDIIASIAINIDDDVEIVSTDKDFLQLSTDRVKIYNPMKKVHVSHPSPPMFLIEQCMIGQSKDSIFNIKTPLDHPEGKRKPGFGPKAFEKVVEYGVKEWLKDNKLEERFKFNRTLIDFLYIPEWVTSSILDVYRDYTYPEPSKMWEFIKDKNWPEFVEQFTQLENKFLELY